MFIIVITAALALLPFCILQPVSAQGNSTNSSSSTGQRLVTVGDINGVNYQTYLYYPSETYPLVNYNDVLIFAWWTNYTNLYLVREQGAGSVQSGKSISLHRWKTASYSPFSLIKPSPSPPPEKERNPPAPLDPQDFQLS